VSGHYPLEITIPYTSIVVSVDHVNLLPSHFILLLCRLWETQKYEKRPHNVNPEVGVPTPAPPPSNLSFRSSDFNSRLHT